MVDGLGLLNLMLGDPCPSGWTNITTPRTSQEEDAKMVCLSDHINW